MGQRAKTDAVDARVLAQMGTALHLRPTEASPPTHRALEELQVARDALVTDRTAARNRQKHLRHRLLKQQSKIRFSLSGVYPEFCLAGSFRANRAEVILIESVSDSVGVSVVATLGSLPPVARSSAAAAVWGPSATER